MPAGSKPAECQSEVAVEKGHRAGVAAMEPSRDASADAAATLSKRVGDLQSNTEGRSCQRLE